MLLLVHYFYFCGGKKMKKILIFVFSILIITGGLLTGCGNNVKEDNNNVINNSGNSQVNSGNNSEINNGGNSEINNVENNENNEINEANTGIKKLIECLYLTTEVDSMELNMTTYANGDGQSVVTKTNMKVEDIKSGMKSLLTVEASGQTQEIYLAVSNGITKMYIKDASGKYSVTELSKEQVGNTDVMGAFKVYVELIENNPDLITIIDNDTFELNIPKEKTAENLGSINNSVY